MASPTPLSKRPREHQVALAVLVPFAFGAVVGVFLGISAGVYWALSALAAIGGVLAGLEHPDWRSGARRVALGGALYGLGLLLAHAVAGTDAKVSLGSFPPLLIVIDALIGALLGALGGRLGSARAR
jgi:hypothetical protein